MTTLFLRNADVLVTMDGDRREIRDGALLVGDNVIRAAGTTDDILSTYPFLSDASAPSAADTQVIDAGGSVVLPGLVNCHHHLYQTLTRTVGTGAGMVLFDWLKTLYPIWAEMDGEAVYVSAKVGLSELVLSGATTVADHLYLFPRTTRSAPRRR
jgi:8-oxoguanine deaminase